LRKWSGDTISDVSGPGSVGAHRQVCKLRAEKPHPKRRRWRHRGPAPLRGRNGLQSSMQVRRSVGKLAASDTQRVELGAKCQ